VDRSSGRKEHPTKVTQSSNDDFSQVVQKELEAAESKNL
jgi:hypothetical protein